VHVWLKHYAMHINNRYINTIYLDQVTNNGDMAGKFQYTVIGKKNIYTLNRT